MEVNCQHLAFAQMSAREDLMVEQRCWAKEVFENITLNFEVQESSSMNRRTRRMAQDELAAMEQNPRLAMFHQNQGV